MTHKRANTTWNITGNTHDDIQVLLLMDIREELQRLNSLIRCQNFLDIPHKLERIARNTVKRRKKRKAPNANQ